MPEATVAAIVTTLDSHTAKVLLTLRNIEPFKGQWCLPGGHIDRYESAEDAIIREVKEETGLDFDPHFFQYFDECVPERDIHAVVIVFTGRGKGVLRAQEYEVTKIGWFAFEEARSLSLAFSHNEILDAYVTQGKSSKGDMHSEMLAEYTALRAEILQRLDMRQQILTFTLVIAGTILSLGMQAGIAPMVLLIYPILALFLARTWMHSDFRIGEIAEYFEKEIEPHLTGIRWETYIHNKYQGRKYRSLEITAAGFFLTTQILTIVLALPQLSYSLEEIILLAAATPAVILTFVSLRSRTGFLSQMRQGAK